MMNDYKLIAELAGLTYKPERWPVLKALGDEAAAEIRRGLPPALGRFRRVIVATHLPPLREACWHEGHISDDEWAPHFTCKASAMRCWKSLPSFADRQIDRLLRPYAQPRHRPPLPNLTIHTGGSEYGRPEIQQLIPLGPVEP